MIFTLFIVDLRTCFFRNLLTFVFVFCWAVLEGFFRTFFYVLAFLVRDFFTLFLRSSITRNFNTFCFVFSFTFPFIPAFILVRYIALFVWKILALVDIMRSALLSWNTFARFLDLIFIIDFLSSLAALTLFFLHVPILLYSNLPAIFQWDFFAWLTGNFGTLLFICFPTVFFWNLDTFLNVRTSLLGNVLTAFYESCTTKILWILFTFLGIGRLTNLFGNIFTFLGVGFFTFLLRNILAGLGLSCFTSIYVVTGLFWNWLTGLSVVIGWLTLLFVSSAANLKYKGIEYLSEIFSSQYLYNLMV